MEFCGFVEPKEESLDSSDYYICKFKQARKKLKDDCCIASNELSMLGGGNVVKYNSNKAKKCPLYIVDEGLANVLMNFFLG